MLRSFAAQLSLVVAVQQPTSVAVDSNGGLQLDLLSADQPGCNDICPFWCNMTARPIFMQKRKTLMCLRRRSGPPVPLTVACCKTNQACGGEPEERECPTTRPPPPASGLRDKLEQREIDHFKLVNMMRKEGFKCVPEDDGEPLPALKLDCTLFKAAQSHAVNMSMGNYLSPRGRPDGSTWQSRASAQKGGIPLKASDTNGNFAGGREGPASALQRFKSLKGMCRKIMDKKWKYFAPGANHNPNAQSNMFKQVWVEAFLKDVKDHEVDESSCVDADLLQTIDAQVHTQFEDKDDIIILDESDVRESDAEIAEEQ